MDDRCRRGGRVFPLSISSAVPLGEAPAFRGSPSGSSGEASSRVSPPGRSPKSGRSDPRRCSNGNTASRRRGWPYSPPSPSPRLGVKRVESFPDAGGKGHLIPIRRTPADGWPGGGRVGTMQNDGLLLLGRASGPIRWTAGEHPLPVTILPRAEEGVSVGATLHTDEASACRRMAGTGRKRRTVLPSRKERAWDEAGDSVREVYGRTSVWMAPHFTRE